MTRRFPEILLVCEDQALTVGFSAMIRSKNPAAQIHCVNPWQPEAWDQCVRATMDRPRVAFVGLKASSAAAALALRERSNSQTIPWMVLMHPETVYEDWIQLPCAKVQLKWDSHDREQRLNTLVEFLETCEFP